MKIIQFCYQVSLIFIQILHLFLNYFPSFKPKKFDKIGKGIEGSNSLNPNFHDSNWSKGSFFFWKIKLIKNPALVGFTVNSSYFIRQKVGGNEKWNKDQFCSRRWCLYIFYKYFISFSRWKLFKDSKTIQGDLHVWRPLLPWFFADSKRKEISKKLSNNIKASLKVMLILWIWGLLLKN